MGRHRSRQRLSDRRWRELCWSMAQGRSEGGVCSCADQWQTRKELLFYVGTGMTACWYRLTLTEDDSSGTEWMNKTWEMLICSWNTMPNRTQQSKLGTDFKVLIIWWFYLPSWAVIMTLTESQKLSITRTGRRVDKSSSKICPPPVPIHSAVFFCRQIVFTLPE